jgi:hypothetical protein
MLDVGMRSAALNCALLLSGDDPGVFQRVREEGNAAYEPAMGFNVLGAAGNVIRNGAADPEQAVRDAGLAALDDDIRAQIRRPAGVFVIGTPSPSKSSRGNTALRATSS